MSLRPLAVAIAVCGLGVAAAADAAHACPPAYAALDDALWQDAKQSGAPTRWVQYFVSQGCDANKQAALALLKPLFGDSTGTGGAASQLVMSGKFSGDRSETWEVAVDGQPLKPSPPRAGAYLYTFHMKSKVVVRDCVAQYRSMDYCLPAALYPDGKLPPETAREKDVALWVQYRCGLVSRDESGWLDDLEAVDKPWGADCPTADRLVYDRIGFRLAGPYKDFFTLAASCVKDGGGDCDDAAGGVSSVTLTLAPAPAYRSFLQLLTAGHAR